MNIKTILLVEDNVSDVELTRRALDKSRVGNPLVVVEDGQSALDFLFGAGVYADRDTSEQPAVILLDLNLPLMDGLEVLRRIRADQRTRRLPVVILTSSKEQKDLSTGYDLGTNSYIVKPVDFAQFVEVIGQLGLYWLVLNESPP